MATKTLFLENAVLSTKVWRKSESAPAVADEVTSVKNGKTVANTYFGFLPGITDNAVNSASFIEGDAGGAHGWRTENVYGGTFASGNWTITYKLKNRAAYAHTGYIYARLYRTTVADPAVANLTKLNSADGVSGLISFAATSGELKTGTFTVNCNQNLVLTDEYLVLILNWKVATPGSNANTGVKCVVNEGAAEQYVTASFTGAPVSLAGVLSGSGTLTGVLGVRTGLAGAVSGVGTITGALTISTTLAGNLAGPGTVTGILGVATGLAGNLSGAGTITGILGVDTSFIGALSGTGTLSGALTVIEGGGEVVELAGVFSGAGTLSGAITKVTGAPPWTGAVYAVVYNLTFADETKRGQMTDAVNQWLIGREVWGQTAHISSESMDTLIARFAGKDDMDACLTFVETQRATIPSESGTSHKHFCGHACGQSCRVIEET